MFQPEIVHAADMLERMEAEVKLTKAQREELPDHQRVPIPEAVAWQEAVVKKLKEFRGTDAVERYGLIRAQHRRAIEEGRDDELSRYIAFVHNVVRLLRQLDRLAPPPHSAPVRQVSTHGHAQVERREITTRYDVFISHASEDKAAIAGPLYEALTALGLTVWFDEAVLELGDSLRRKIDEGLAKSLFGVVILSPSFFSKEWPRRELDGLVARETASGEKALLPVWHEVSGTDVASYSPTLADRLAIKSSLGAAAVAERIKQVVDRKRGARGGRCFEQPTT
jgi:hypothetical protein